MRADNDLFGILFDYVNVALPNNVEKEWAYLGMEIWPIVKSQVVMRGSNIFFAGRDMTLVKDKKPETLPAKRTVFSRLFGSSVQSPDYPSLPENDESYFKQFTWPDFPGLQNGVPDILCFGYATNHKQFGDAYFQLCMDPCRLAFEQAGRSSVCFIAGLSPKSDGVRSAALENTYGLEPEFRAVRRYASELPPVNLRGCAGFMEWWSELDRLLGHRQFTTIEHIENIIQQTRIVAEWLYRTFHDNKPKAVLVAAYYGLIGHGASWAFRRMGVSVADVQHGVAGPGHHAYSWPTAPQESYETLPTHFLVWSAIEYRHMSTGSGNWMPGIVVIGNIWKLLDDVIDFSESSKLLVPEFIESAKQAMREQSAQFEKLPSQGEGKPRDILLALHPDETLEWFENVKKRGDDNWRYHIRLHPGEYSKADKFNARVANLEKQNVYVTLPTMSPLNIVLQHCDLILTKYSSVALDALAYGVPTVAYSDAAVHFFGPAEVSGIKVVLPYTDGIVAGIRQRLSVYGADLFGMQPSSNFNALGEALTYSLIESSV